MRSLYTMLLSFDVGVRNLGYAVLAPEGYVAHAGTVTIKPRVNRVVDTIRTVRELVATLTAIAEPYSLQTVLVEKQLHRNPSMRVVQAILQSYFCILFPRTKVLEYSPKKKLRGEGKCKSYHARKKRAVELVLARLDATQGNSEAYASIRALKKKDDAADAILQAWAYLDVDRHAPETAVFTDEDVSDPEPDPVV